MNRQFVTRCAIAGALWGAGASVLGGAVFGSLVISGVAASPLIGLVIGAMSLAVKRAPRFVKAMAAGVSLYESAVLFGSILGFVRLMSRAANQTSEVFVEPILALLWGLTFTGLFVFLWPFSYVTQEWVLSASSDASE